MTDKLENARALHRTGQFGAAIAAYEALLAEDAGRADLWHLKGMAEHQSGLLDAAEASVARAKQIAGDQPMLLMLEGGLLHDRGDLAAAEAVFQRVVAAKPAWPAPLLELGRVRMDQGRPDGALEAFRAASDRDGKSLRAWNGIGLALMGLGRLEEALRAFNHGLTIDPAYPYAHFNIARIHHLKLDSKRALHHATAAVRADPGLVDAHLLIGDIHRRARQTAEALAAYQVAVRAAPSNPKALNGLAELLAEMGRTDEARRGYLVIADRFPGNLKAALGANLLLPQVYVDLGHVEHERQEYLKGLERLDELSPNFRYPRGDVALAEAKWTNFYLAYQGREDAQAQSRYGEFLRGVLQRSLPAFYEPLPKRTGGERIRVGFLSHFFYNCTVGRYFASWLKTLDKSRFEVVVFYTNEWVADDTKAIAAAVDKFHHLPGRSMYAVAEHVRAADLDILVYPELGMHPETFTLASLRLAPVQCSGWGHPDTTGHGEIDWFISCEAMEPPNAHRLYTEQLALLPGLGTRYARPTHSDKSTRADFGLPEDKTLYLLPQSLFKIHPENDPLAAEVLLRDPDGLLVVFASGHDDQTHAYARRLAQAFEARKLDMGERVRFVEAGIPHGAYLRLNELCDVMLDTVHWSGGNTSLDALASGLPVVTLPGHLMRGRQSLAMLTMLGVDELVTENQAQYIERAVAVGRDRDLRRSLSERIVGNLDRLFDRDEPVRALEKFFERAVGR